MPCATRTGRQDAVESVNHLVRTMLFITTTLGMPTDARRESSAPHAAPDHLFSCTLAVTLARAVARDP